MCEVLDVSRSGFYAWLKRDRPDREKEDAELVGGGPAGTPPGPCRLI
jgi:hypothetical protein